jgi:hypothetical protein
MVMENPVGDFTEEDSLRVYNKIVDAVNGVIKTETNSAAVEWYVYAMSRAFILSRVRPCTEKTNVLRSLNRLSETMLSEIRGGRRLRRSLKWEKD